MSYDNLDANSTLKQSVIDTCKMGMAANASTDASNVEVSLSKGSVSVNYVITVAANQASTVASNLETSMSASSTSMMTDLLNALNGISGTRNVVDGTLAIADVSTPTVSTDNTDAATMGASSVYTARLGYGSFCDGPRRLKT